MNESDELNFTERLRNRLSQNLPGPHAHELLRAIPVSEQALRFKYEGLPRPGAVLIMLCGNPDQLWFPLIKRTETGGIHSGQISLPGGRLENNENPIETALREAEEEIGIEKSQVEIIGTLSNFHVIPSHYLVTPVVGRWRGDSIPRFKRQEKEVAGIIKSSVSELIKVDAVKQAELEVRGYRLIAPHFLVEDQIVWGATAMMLNEFRVVLREMRID